MTPTATPRPQISPSEAETLRTHARAIVEGEGAEDSTLARDIVGAILNSLAIDGVRRDQYRQVRMVQAALSTIRKHQAGEDA